MMLNWRMFYRAGFPRVSTPFCLRTALAITILGWGGAACAQDQPPKPPPAAQPPQQTPQSAPAQDGQPPAGPTAAPPPPPSFATAGPWSFTGFLVGDVLSDVAGGLHPGLKLLGKASLSAAYDGSQDGHDGLNGLVSAQYVHGGHPSANNVGDVQGVTNIEAFSALRLYELWVSKDYGGHGWKAGLIDLNVDFDTQNVGALFLNSADGIGPEFAHSGLNGPSIFPTTALGITGYVRPNPGLTIRAGLFDGTAGSPDNPGAFAIRLSGKDGVLGIAQAERRFDSGLRLEAGAWAYSAFFDALHRFDGNGNPLRYQRSRGAYATVEGPIWTNGSDSDRGLAGWVRIGLADTVVQRVSGYVGGGIVYSGPLASRKQDQLGFAINHAIVDAPVPDPAIARTGAETTFELSYRYNVSDALAVQPDAQYVRHPDGDAKLADALVVGVRFSITLTRNLAMKIRQAAPAP
jgi:porin